MLTRILLTQEPSSWSPVMTFQYRLCILFGLLILSVGCSNPRRIDVTTETRFKETLEAMKKSLSEHPTKQQKLDFAIGMIGVNYLGSGTWKNGTTFKEVDGLTYEEVIIAANTMNKRKSMDIDAMFAGRDRLSKVIASKTEAIASEQQDDLKSAIQTIREREIRESSFTYNGVQENRVADMLEKMTAEEIIAHSKSLDNKQVD